MKIKNIRVLNNYKVKLKNATLAGVNAGTSIVFEDGTRNPTIPTGDPVVPTDERFNLVFNYLIQRYEPGWSAGDPATGKAATMALLGVSAAINPLILGNTVESAFKYAAYAGSSAPSSGWFDPLVHPKDFAQTVRDAYVRFERARSPENAKHKFVELQLLGIGNSTSTFGYGGNRYFNVPRDGILNPFGNLNPKRAMNLDLNYANGIERIMIHSPYGRQMSPMSPFLGGEAKRSIPWISKNYTGDGFNFDAYLRLRESTTLRDLLNDYTVERDPLDGLIVNGTGDAHLNTSYRDMYYPAGYISKELGTRSAGGYSGEEVFVGSPWMRYPQSITWTDGWWGGAVPGLCFNQQTLELFDGSTFPNFPQLVTDIPLGSEPNLAGISYGYGESLLNDLNELADVWGNSMEFIAYLGHLPYGNSSLFMKDHILPLALYRDPTIAGNAEYFRWRLDASVQHWKDKFRSPIDGFAHCFIDASALIERTYHQYAATGYTLWTNIAANGESFIENIPVSWARDQYNYTHGPSGPNGSEGIVLGTEIFAQYMFRHDRYFDTDPTDRSMQRYLGDPEPRHWCLDDDIATTLWSSLYDMTIGTRKRGFTYANSIWGRGVCGDSDLGEIFMGSDFLEAPLLGRPLDGYPFFYNTFIEGGESGVFSLQWKRVPNTEYIDGNGVPWNQDRRFRLFYFYPTMLALNGSILDVFHHATGYYDAQKTPWFDIRLGNILKKDMETLSLGSVVSDYPLSGRRTPTTPPQNYWTGIARTSEFELLYVCMKAGITTGLDSLGFEELYNELVNGEVEPPDTSREGYFRALDFNVYGVAYFGYTGDAPSIVPLIKPYQSSLIRYRGDSAQGDTAGLSADMLEDYVQLAQQIPYERRTIVPTWWLLDGPPAQRKADYFWKQTTDGLTYLGGLTGFTYTSLEYGGTYRNLDTVPLTFLTPWAYENRESAKQSFKAFLQQTKDAGVLFKDVRDDSESLTSFGLGGFYNNAVTPNSQSALDAHVTSKSWLEAPDARRIVALKDDARFRGITNSITGRSWADEFKHHYDAILADDGQGVCGASAEAILESHFASATNRLDFKRAFGLGDDILRQAYAWIATNYIFCHGDLKAEIIGGGLDETTGYENAKKFSSEVFAMNVEESKYAVDLNGHRKVQPHIPGYGHLVHFYGQLSGTPQANGVGGGGGLINSFGYPSEPSEIEDVKFGKRFGYHPVSEGGITFGCSAYQAVVHDLKRIRGILRTRPEAYYEGIRGWINGGISGSFGGYSGDTQFTQFYAGNCYAREYYLEHVYHLCLNGVEEFGIFCPNNNVDLANEALVNWRYISGNTRTQPCTNSTGSTGATMDRIDLYEAGTNLIISGGYTGNPDRRLWRITVPHNKNVLLRTDATQTELSSRIEIEDGSRGVWIDAPASYGMPSYESEFEASVTDIFDYPIWAAHWDGQELMSDPGNTGVNGFAGGNWAFPAIVPIVRPIYNARTAGDTGTNAITDDRFDEFVAEISNIPSGRRVVAGRYWQQMFGGGPPNVQSTNYGLPFGSYEEFYEATGDGTTFNDVRFLTPWADAELQDGKDSLRAFLDRCDEVGLTFDYVQDDKEHWGYFWLQNTTHGSLNAAVLNDERFVNRVNPLSGLSFGAEFIRNYMELSGITIAPSSVEEVLGDIVGDNGEDGSIPLSQVWTPYGAAVAGEFGTDRRANGFTLYHYAYPAWNAVTDYLYMNEYSNKMFVDVFAEYPNHSHAKLISYSYFPIGTAEAAFFQASNLEPRYRYSDTTVLGGPNIYGDTRHNVVANTDLTFPVFGSSAFESSWATRSGYVRTAVTDKEKYNFIGHTQLNYQGVTANGGTFGSPERYLVRYPETNPGAEPQVDAGPAPTFDQFFDARTQSPVDAEGNQTPEFTAALAAFQAAFAAWEELDAALREAAGTEFETWLANKDLFLEERAYKYLVYFNKSVRIALRTEPLYWQRMTPWIQDITRTTSTIGSGRVTGAHWYELLYHYSVMGSRFFNIFTETSTNLNGLGAFQTYADEWVRISGGSRAIPCVNSTGDITLPVDRILLEDAFDKVLMSGGKLENTGEFLWRISVPPKFFDSNGRATLRRVGDGAAFEDIPETIIIEGTNPWSARGCWIKRNVSTPPEYIPVVPT